MFWMFEWFSTVGVFELSLSNGPKRSRKTRQCNYKETICTVQAEPKSRRNVYRATQRDTQREVDKYQSAKCSERFGINMTTNLNAFSSKFPHECTLACTGNWLDGDREGKWVTNTNFAVQKYSIRIEWYHIVSLEYLYGDSKYQGRK